MIVAANKVDIMQDPELLERLRAHVEAQGLELFTISAAAHQGVRELVKRCAQELQDLPPVAVFEPTYVERPPEVDTTGEVSIEKFDDTWVVEAPWLQRLMANVNFSPTMRAAAGSTGSCAPPASLTSWRPWASRTGTPSPCTTWNLNISGNPPEPSAPPPWGGAFFARRFVCLAHILK